MSQEEQGMSAVFYVDGSCRPHNPGYIGWGFHGYLYKEASEKPVSVENFQVTSHGYIAPGVSLPDKCKNITPIIYVDGVGSHLKMMTNNVAEVLGVKRVLEYVQSEKLQEVRIFTDSDYSRAALSEWCKRWEANGWRKQDGNPVSNREHLEPTYRLLKDLRTAGAKIHLNWIRSHNGHIGNERADVLAGIGGIYSQYGDVVDEIYSEPAKTYWKLDAEKSPYLAFRRLYFNSIREYHRPGVYHIAEASDAAFVVGKPSASSGYSVLYLKEPDPVIEMVKEKQFEISKGINNVFLMKLDSVFSKSAYPWLSRYGKYSLMKMSNAGHSLSLVNKLPISVEMNPASLPLNALNYFSFLEDLLIAYKDCQDTQEPFLFGAIKVTTVDVTDRYFEVEVKKEKVKHVLKPEFIVGFKNMSLDIEYEYKGKKIPVKVSYALGYDCLPRNNLKYLETARPRMTLLAWEDGQVLKHATVIESDFGIGIWANFFANQILLPKTST